MAKELPERSQVPVEDTWDLTALYDSKEAWEKDLARVDELTTQMEAFAGCLGQDSQTLLQAMRKDEEIGITMGRVYNYAARLNDQDLGDAASQEMNGKAMTAYAQVSARLSFFTPELIDIPADRLNAFYEENKDLALYKNAIDEIVRVKEHICSPEIESLLASGMEMRQVAEETYGVFSDSDLVYPEITDENGEKVRVTNGRFVRLLESEDRRVREDTFKAYYSIHKQFNNTFASLLAGQIKQLTFMSRARKYPSNLEASVDGNHVPSFVYRNLVDTVNQNLDKLHRYVAIRKKLLNVDELHMYDIYVPMIAGVAQSYDYETAKEMTLEALKPLGEDYLAVVQKAYAERWIDVYENKGKRSGAYSATTYGVHPYMLLNHNGSLDSVFTLIHEMGHSLHSYYSNAAQPAVYAEYKIFVAEVASTCNEVLLLEYLLAKENDPKKRAYLLNHYLDMFKGTLFRQTQFAEFEMKINELSERGEVLTGEMLSSLYLEMNKKYYGPDMVSDPEIAYEWSRIPHFYYDFYVYQYATSFCASVAIAHDLLEKGEEAVARYKEFLSGGCSLPPVELLRKAGVDFASAAPIQSCMDVMSHVLDELEKLI